MLVNALIYMIYATMMRMIRFQNADLHMCTRPTLTAATTTYITYITTITEAATVDAHAPCACESAATDSRKVEIIECI